MQLNFTIAPLVSDYRELRRALAEALAAFQASQPAPPGPASGDKQFYANVVNFLQATLDNQPVPPAPPPPPTELPPPLVFADSIFTSEVAMAVATVNAAVGIGEFAYDIHQHAQLSTDSVVFALGLGPVPDMPHVQSQAIQAYLDAPADQPPQIVGDTIDNAATLGTKELVLAIEEGMRTGNYDRYYKAVGQYMTNLVPGLGGKRPGVGVRPPRPMVPEVGVGPARPLGEFPVLPERLNAVPEKPLVPEPPKPATDIDAGPPKPPAVEPAPTGTASAPEAAPVGARHRSSRSTPIALYCHRVWNSGARRPPRRSSTR